ncbi:MAG: uncharacterized protein KVP18_000534 [Porospora cf. gigantea A]|uniref:uncharacterized protein n=1 Tax=Porospora cf. gigantea A TaxID=2853593 RepID=UPI003559A09E|nr:MAG: hypothetical protein KVP18_000534 [Porospora cf. gigantea A]
MGEPNAARIKQQLSRVLKTYKAATTPTYLRGQRSDGFLASSRLRMRTEENIGQVKPLLLEHKLDVNRSVEYSPIRSFTTPSLLALTGLMPGVVGQQTQQAALIHLLEEYPSTGTFSDAYLSALGINEEVPLDEEDLAIFFDEVPSRVPSPRTTDSPKTVRVVTQDGAQLTPTADNVQSTFDPLPLAHPLFAHLKPMKVFDLKPHAESWSVGHRHGIFHGSRDMDRRQVLLTCRESAGDMKLYSAYSRDVGRRPPADVRESVPGTYAFLRDFVTRASEEEGQERYLCLELPEDFTDSTAPVKQPIRYFGLQGHRIHFDKASAKLGSTTRTHRRPIEAAFRDQTEQEAADMAQLEPQHEFEEPIPDFSSVSSSSLSSDSQETDSELSSEVFSD